MRLLITKLDKLSSFRMASSVTYQSCGVNLRVALDNEISITIKPMERVDICAGIQWTLPNKSCTCLIYPHSTCGVTVIPKFVHSNHPNEITFTVFNITSKDVVIKHGMKIAKMKIVY